MSNPDNASFGIDYSLVRKTSDRAQSEYSAHSEVPDTIADRLYERLELLKEPPARVLDVGTGNGRHLKVLRQLFPRAVVVGADISTVALRCAPKTRFWQRSPLLVALDASAGLPFSDGSFDLVVSNLMLPWILPAEVFAAELNRILSDNGAFFLSSVGPDTLQELRYAWRQIDDAEHINVLLDMHDVGDLLHRAGIADPVMDAERLTVEYPSVPKLLSELVQTGCCAVVSGRRRGLMGSDITSKLAAAYPDRSSDGNSDSSSIDATLEVVYAHGWKGKPKVAGGQAGEFVINLDRLRKSGP